jgi:hypothetical protein
VANEVCQRAGKAYVAEQLPAWETHTLWIKAVNCRNGEILAQEQLTAGSKEQVLVSLRSCHETRQQLGEL